MQVAGEAHWPELSLVILIASDRKKDTGSTEGMQRSVETSELLAHRRTTVPVRLARMEEAYRARDFGTFAELTVGGQGSKWQP